MREEPPEIWVVSRTSERADLVERLRNLEGNHDLFREAADEIERLREALELDDKRSK